MVDALASGASVRKDVEVQVLSRVPSISTFRKEGVFAFYEVHTYNHSMKLYFARHGQTDANANGVALTSSEFLDGSLNQLGTQQAKELAIELKTINFDIIISSPLKRAYETAEAVNEYHNLPIKVDDSWRERDAEVYADISMWNDIFDFDKNIEVKNGESLKVFFERVYAAIDKLRQDYNSQTVLIVSHGGVQHALYAYSNNLPWSGNMRIKPMKNCEYRIYDL